MIIMEEEESSNTVLHAVDIRAAKGIRRIQPCSWWDNWNVGTMTMYITPDISA